MPSIPNSRELRLFIVPEQTRGKLQADSLESFYTNIYLSLPFMYILFLIISYVFRKDFDSIAVVEDMLSLPMVYRKLIAKFHFLSFLDSRGPVVLRLLES